MGHKPMKPASSWDGALSQLPGDKPLSPRSSPAPHQALGNWALE